MARRGYAARMTLADALFAAVVGALIWAFVLHFVIRKAVCRGILDADRLRQQAEAERQRVVAKQNR